MAVLATPKALKATKEPEKDRAVKKGVKTANPNPADSSREVIRRRKEREKPKAKKLTNLKKTILKEKASLQQNHHNAGPSSASAQLTPTISASPPSDSDIPADFELEGGERPPPVEDDTSRSEHHTEKAADSEDSIHKQDAKPLSALPIPPEKMTIPVIGPREYGSLKILSSLADKEPYRYCNQIITPDLNKKVRSFIGELIRFQDRMKARDPVKVGGFSRMPFAFFFPFLSCDSLSVRLSRFGVIGTTKKKTIIWTPGSAQERGTKQGKGRHRRL